MIEMRRKNIACHEPSPGERQCGLSISMMRLEIMYDINPPRAFIDLNYAMPITSIIMQRAN